MKKSIELSLGPEKDHQADQSAASFYPLEAIPEEAEELELVNGEGPNEPPDDDDEDPPPVEWNPTEQELKDFDGGPCNHWSPTQRRLCQIVAKRECKT